MPDHRRNQVPGGAYFFTVTLLDRSSGLLRRAERGVWQRRFWEHTIRDDRDYAAHMDYAHFNPVKHGLVEHPAYWAFSSFYRCVNAGLYPPGWCHDADVP